MNKTYITATLVVIIGLLGCSQNTGAPSSSTSNSGRSILATVSAESTAYLVNENGERIVSEEHPGGIEVVLSKNAKLIVSSKDLHLNRGYIWEYSLIMLLVFAFLLTILYAWEKFKRR
jgi:hypothetical protein